MTEMHKVEHYFRFVMNQKKKSVKKSDNSVSFFLYCLDRLEIEIVVVPLLFCIVACKLHFLSMMKRADTF